MITYGSTTLTSYNSIVKTEVYYYKSTSPTALSGGSWSTAKPTWESGKYVWQKIRTIYEDETYTESDPVNITGQQGATGTAAYSYKLNASDTAVTVSKTGEYSVNKITFTATYKQGTGAVTAYAGRFKIETTLNGTTWTTAYTSSGNESSKQYILPENIISIRCSLYQAGGTSVLLDITTIPIVKDGIDAIGLRDSIPYYLASDKQTGVTRLDQGWTRFKPELTTEKRYLWVYYVSRYSEGDTQPELIEIKNDVISFENHGDESPVEDCIVDINPVQDLHGYDSPWVGGAGVNLLKPVETTVSSNGITVSGFLDGKITISGTATNDAQIQIWPTPITAERYSLILKDSINGSASTWWISISGVAPIYSGKYNSHPFVSAGNFPLRINVKGGVTVNTTVYPMVAKSDIELPYTPYSNICPISGWTNVKINASKKNLFNKDTVTNDAVMAWANAKIGTETGSWVSDYIPFIKNTNYKLNYNTSQIFIFDDEKNAILIYRNGNTWTALDGTGGGGGQTFTTPNRGTYLRFCYRKSGSTSAVSPDLIQLELGTTSTTYESYQGNIYDIQFPSEAETVYGGTLDVTTGRLTVDKTIVDLSTLTYQTRFTGDNKKCISAPLPINYPENSDDYFFITENYKYNGIIGAANFLNPPDEKDTGIYSYYNSTNPTSRNNLYIITLIEDIPSGKVVYHIANPITYQLTPQEITMLTGQNYIFSNTGQTVISYYDKQTSTDPYIDYSATSAFEVAQSVSDAIGALESPYKEVEWVESNGKQYVYLDWKPPIKTWGFEADFISRNAVNSSQGAWNESTNANGYGTIFGVRNASGINNAQLSSYNNGLLRLGNGNNVVTGFKTDHSRQTIKLHGTTLTKTDGTTTTVTRTDENTSKPYCNMTVFCLYEGLRRASTGSISEPSSTRIYSLKFYDGDTLTVDLVGAIRKADNITGLYDKVSKHFYPAPRMSFGNDVGDIPITDTITDALNKNDVKCTVVNKNCSRMWETAVPFNRLEDGQKITITYSYGTLVNSVQTSELVGWDDTWSNSNVYLRLIYPDGVKSEWIPCYYSQTGRLTTHYGAGTPITLTYHENILSNATETAAGSSIVRGFFANANYDTNTSYTQYSAVKAGVNGIKGYTLAMRDSENTWSCFYSGAYKGTSTGKVVYTGGFILGKVIYSSGAGAQTSNSSLDTYYNYKEGVITSTNYDAYPVDLRYSTNCATTLIAQRPVYLVGTVENDGLFHLDASQWWTQTEPTFKDNKVYVYLGVAYSTYQIWLSTDNPAYMFYNDKFILYDRALTLQDIDSLKETLESQIDGKVETWCQKSNPATNWSAEERPNHTGDLWYYIGESDNTYKNNTTYQYNGNTNTWTAYSANPDLFDKIDGKTAIYYGTQSSVISAEEGDYLVDSTDGSSYRWNNGAWVKVTDYKTAINNIQIGGRNLLCNSNQSLTTVSSKGDFYLSETIPTGTTVIASVQIDADDITWVSSGNRRIGFEISQSSDGIATGTQYVGVWWGKSGTTNNGADISYNTSSTGATSYHGRIWSKVTLTRPFLADIKRGGIYVQGIASGTYKISNPKVEIATKPSDWTPAPEDVEEEISNLRTDLQSQIDEKIQTYYQSTNPASSWTTAEARAPHDGDLWYYTGTTTSTYTKDNVYRYNASNNTWSVYSASGELFDKVDGKSTIYYGTTSGTYTGVETGDYLVDSTDGSSYRWDGSKWVKVTDYKTAIDNIEIGGRNLLKGTATGEGWTYTSFDSNTKTFTRSNSTLSEKYIQSGWATEPLQSGQEYTISCWMKTNGYVSSVDVFIVDKNVKTSRSKNYPKTSLSTEWQYYKTVLKTIDPLPSGVDLNNWYVRFDNNATTENGTEAILYVKDIKLEKGNKATDWTPAPEDITRGTGFYSITTTPTVYTTTTGGFTPAYRIALSTVKTESGLEEVMVGDVIQQGYNTYPVGYVDTSYVYLGAVNSIRGATGAAGLNTARVVLYRRFASAPTGTNVAPTGDVTYTFSTGVAANNLNSWTQAIPSGTDPVYMITASASSTGTTDKIPKTEWSAPVKILENGKNGNPGGNGSDGYNQATIYLYQRKSGTAPSKPSSAVEYTFSTGALKTTPTGWSRTIPANDGNPCYVTTAVAFAKTATYSIPASGWSDVVILSQDGADGVSVTNVTSTNNTADGGTSVVTITLSDGTTKTFNVKNGTKGNTGATAQWYYGTSLTHTSGTATLVATSTSGAVVGSMYLNTQTSLVYKCTAVGTNNTWTYAGDLTTGVIDNIEIGGRNLLLNTTISATNLSKIKAPSTFSFVTEDNINCYKTTGSNTSHIFNSINAWDCMSEKLKANTTYTYSAWIKADKTKAFGYTQYGHFNVSNDASTKSDKSHEDIPEKRIYKPEVIEANQWTKISITFTTNELDGSSFGVFPVYNTGNDTILYIYGMKLEKGTKATDWTPAPEDVDANIQQVQTNLDNLEIGGRNLLLNSGEHVSTSYRIFTYPLSSMGQELQEGDVFTFSMKATIPSDRMRWAIYNSGSTVVIEDWQNITPDGTNAQIYTLTGQWKITKGSTVATNTSLFLYIGTNESTSQTTVHWAKLERGNKSTSWTPAPEDTDASIQQVQTNLDNLEIGGRNLLKNSKALTTNWTLDQATVTDGVVTITPTATSDRRMYQMPANGYWTWTLGQEYTVSVAARSDNGATFRFQANGAGKSSSSIPVTSDWQRYSFTFIATSASGGSMTFAMVETSGKTIQFKEPKLEYGGKATDWTPAPEDTQADINTAIAQSVEYVIGTQTATTGTWTGRASTLSELKDGTQIRYWLPYAGSGNATLNLTLKDGTATGAIPVYRQGGSANSSGVVTANRVTTHFPAGTSISMVYGINRVVSAVYNNVTYTGTFTGWFADGAYDSGNTYNRTKMQNAITAVTAITSGRIICGTILGYKNIGAGIQFDLSYPLLYAASAITAGKTSDNNYLQINSISVTGNGTVQSGAAKKELYLKGTVTGNTFTIASSPFMTTVIPTSTDGFYYIPLGMMYSTTAIYFISSNRLYAYLDGAFQSVDIAAVLKANSAYDTAVQAQSEIVQTRQTLSLQIRDISVGGANLFEKTKAFEDTANEMTAHDSLTEFAYKDLTIRNANSITFNDQVVELSAYKYTDLTSDMWYTFSFYAKGGLDIGFMYAGTGNATIDNIIVSWSDETYTGFNATSTTSNIIWLTPTTNWQRYNIVFHVAEQEITASQRLIGLYARPTSNYTELTTEASETLTLENSTDSHFIMEGNEISICGYKLELGNKPTDWTPSEKDKTSYNNIISQINLSQEGVSIKADKINLEGTITANNGFIIDEYGNMTANNGTFNGLFESYATEINENTFDMKISNGHIHFYNNDRTLTEDERHVGYIGGVRNTTSYVNDSQKNNDGIMIRLYNTNDFVISSYKNNINKKVLEVVNHENDSISVDFWDDLHIYSGRNINLYAYQDSQYSELQFYRHSKNTNKYTLKGSLSLHSVTDNNSDISDRLYLWAKNQGSDLAGDQFLYFAGKGLKYTSNGQSIRNGYVVTDKYIVTQYFSLSNQNITKNTSKNFTIDVTRDGYTPIMFVPRATSGTNAAYLSIYNWALSGNTANIYTHNISTTEDITNITIWVQVLYKLTY